MCEKAPDSCPYIYIEDVPIPLRSERCVKKLLIDIHMDGNIFLINTRPKKCVKVSFDGKIYL